jgi:hypothetical protein
MLRFNTLLKEAGFDPERVFLLRHEDSRVSIGIYQAWKSRIKDFEAYQSSQKWTNRFPEGFSLAAFVVGPERETLFVGMYDVLRQSRRSGPFHEALLGPMPDEDRSWHDTKHSERMREYEERLVVEWGPGKLAWRQHAHEHNKVVLEIRAQPNEPPFPGYMNFRRRLGELATIYPPGSNGSKSTRACIS